MTLRSLRTGLSLVALACAAAPASAQYGDAYHRPNTMALQQMASQRASQMLNDHYRRLSQQSASRTSTLPWNTQAFRTADDEREERAARPAAVPRPDAARRVAAASSGGPARTRCGEGCSQTLRLPGGSTYTDQTDDGVPHGPGTLVMSGGARFSGTWREGTLQAPIKLVYSDGTVYEGGFDGKTPQGAGTLTHRDGIRDRGTFVDGRLEGDVERVQVTDGVRFVTRGPYKAGLPVGVHETIVTGGKIKRTVENFDQPSQSRAEWNDGNTFVGALKEGLPAEGKLTYASGDTFAGLFHDSGAPRVGLHTAKTGTTQYGYFNDTGKRHGYVAATYRDGSAAEMMYDNDRRVGPVLRTMGNGDIVTGMTGRPGQLVFGMMVPAGAAADAARPAAIDSDGKLVELPESEHAAARQAALDAARVIAAERAKIKQLLEP